MEDQIQRTVDSEVVTTRKRRRPREKEAINQATGPEAIDQRPSDETKALEQSAPSRQVDQSHQTTNTEAIFPSKRHSPLAATSNLPDQPEASSSKLPPLATEPGEPALQTRKRFRRHHREMASEKGTTEQRPVKKSKKIKGKEREKEQGKHPKKKTKETTKEKRKERAQEVEEEIPSWDCLPIAQNEVLRILPVWSKDGRFYFTVAKTSIHVHSSTPPSFARLSTLCSNHSQGHKQPITSLLLSPTNPFQLMTSSEDGTVKIWDWSEGRLIRTITMYGVPCRVRQMCIGEVAGKWWIFATITHERTGRNKTSKQRMKMNKKKDMGIIEDNHRVVRASLAPPAKGNPGSPREVARVSAPPAAIFVSPRSTYLVALAGSKAYTFRLPTSAPDASKPDVWVPKLIKLVSDQPFTCGAFSPERVFGGRNVEEEWFATGDARGIIRLWHGLEAAFRQLDAVAAQKPGIEESGGQIDMEKRLPTTSLHWHAHAVSAIAFTPSGAQLLSVGEESVLVQWHLASGKRQYIPRLGGTAILSLAVRRGSRGVEEEWWMGFADGSVVRVGAASGTVSTVERSVRLDPLRAISDNMPLPLALHPATGAIVVPSSHPSTLQFIDPLTSSILFDLEVVPSNRISRRDDKELEPIAVEQVAFSDVQDGESRWMATMEGRKGDQVEGGGMVKNLKIWRWDGHKYVVNTQFPRPHGLSDISTLAFSPIPQADISSNHTITLHLFTTAIDGTAKLWQVRQAKKSEQGKTAANRPDVVELFWSTRSTFDYRSMPIHAAAFSSDATIVALAHGAVVTLWDVDSNILLKVLEDASVSDAHKVAFVGPEGQYLVAAGKRSGIAVWDLLSCGGGPSTLAKKNTDVYVIVLWASSSTRCDKLLSHTSRLLFISSSTDGRNRSLVTVFSPSDPKHLRQYQVQPELSDICSLPSSAPVDTDRIQFIGIVKNGEVYRFGGAVSSSAPKTDRVAGQPGTKKPLSIWQEMFGKDAFLEDLETAPGTIPPPRASKVGRPSEVFDGPSHTMPPVGSLFDAFMEELLSVKTSGAREDDAMATDQIIYEEPNSAPALPMPAVEESRTRPVTDEEVRDLTAFFRETLASKVTNAKTPYDALPNGHVHTNGDVVPPKPAPPMFIDGRSVDEEPSAVTAPSATKPIKKLVDGDIPTSDGEEEEREIIEHSAEGKRKGRKRKAPKEVS